MVTKIEKEAELTFKRFSVRLDASDATIYDLVRVRSELNKCGIALLRELFKMIVGKEGKGNKSELADAIAYSLQVKYYSKFMKTSAPQNVLDKTENLVKRCLN